MYKSPDQSSLESLELKVPIFYYLHDLVDFNNTQSSLITHKGEYNVAFPHQFKLQDMSTRITFMNVQQGGEGVFILDQNWISWNDEE